MMIQKKYISYFYIIFISLLSIVVSVYANRLSNTDYTIERDVFSQGAIKGETEHYNIQSTIGQGTPVSVLNSTSYNLRSGFVVSTDDGWEATINAIGEDLGVTNQYDIFIGVSSKEELIEAPPMAPPDCTVIMDLLINWEKYTKVILAEGEKTYSWVIAIDPHGTMLPPNARTASIMWDPSQFHPDADLWFYRLKEGYTGKGRTVVSDMRKITEYQVTGDKVQYLTLECTQDKCIEIEITLKAGWNLISIPVEPCDSKKLNDLFPDATVAYGFDSSYKYAEELEPQQGYWIKVPENKTYIIRGQDMSGYSKFLTKGWYLMGSINCKQSVPETDIPEALGPIYGFDRSYTQPIDNILEPGQGYWVKINQDSLFSVKCK